MEPKGKILVVDDNEDVLLSLNMLLKPHTEAVRVISKPERIVEFMDSFAPDVILLDMNFKRDAISGEEGYEWLSKILEHDPHAVVLFITAYVTTEKAVRAIKAGAVDFIPKPWDKDKLLGTIRSAIDLSRTRHGGCLCDKEEEEDTRDAFDEFIGESPAILELKRQLKRVAATDANVLVTGENGTGKDVVAHALHALSRRSDKAFVNIDLGCIPDSLFESELFGHEKGAFTDAKTTKEGRIESADGGTLFLDEIGNLPLHLQQKLLTVIEKRQVSRVGSNNVRNVDVRIVTATNADLHAMVRNREFRQDLLYRINTIELHLPPLRERGDDIILLANHFLKSLAQKYQMDYPSLSAEACDKLLKHSWHGNVRELQHCMEHSMVLSDHNVLSADDIVLEKQSTEATKDEGFQDGILNLEDLQRNAIRRAVSICDGNLTQAAEMLGITRFALYRKIDKLGI
ncbi:MAG: sigma-54-dependent Fis family transcriptional regulator [Bacteroidaceae bacterium]|nr:sigma-54-dependent Fis family transcriptional regulator [Bacteroidaceae bacterium]